MIIQKVINNNVVSAFDHQNKEVVVMGRGIGFRAHCGDCIDEQKIEKVFRIKDQALSRQFQEIVEGLPLEHMQISVDIINLFKSQLTTKLNQSIYISLTDHINAAIERNRQGILLPNALLWEIRQFYPEEYLLGKKAVDLLNAKFRMHFSDDEAGFIALHFVNAEYDNSSRQTLIITSAIQKVLQITTDYMGPEYKDTSTHYECYVAHVKYLIRRIMKNELLLDDEPELSELIRKRFVKEFLCAEAIAQYLHSVFGVCITNEEKMYLAIHIRRLYRNE